MSAPYLKQKRAGCTIHVNGRDMILIAGEVHNSDASSPAYMEKIWACAEALGMNALLLPVSWEMVEPEEGKFDFSVADTLIAQARACDMKIVFLWFGSWKNASCMYAPAWVKRDLVRFRRGQIERGKNKAPRRDFYNLPYTTLSYLCEETMRADAKAFSRFMSHLRETDGEENTVVAVQVENETGLLGSARERSEEADALFAAPVPDDFVQYMCANTADMVPSVAAAVQQGARQGSWAQVFGEAAEEVFSAYHVARFVNGVAAAGKREYALPMAVNCWLDNGEPAGRYPSGGPVSRMYEVWKYCAPAIDLFCPDIYVPDFCGVCDEYTRRGTPLFIPECATHSYAAPRLAYCIGHYHAACYAPFGLDDIGKPFTAVQNVLFGVDVTDPALKTPQSAEEYGWFARTLRSMTELLAARYGTSDLQAVCAERKENSVMEFGDFRVHALFDHPMLARHDGVCLACKVAGDECYLIANGCGLMFTSAAEGKSHLDLIDLEEGAFEGGRWVPARRLNGDEAAFMKYETPVLLRVKVFVYGEGGTL